jgi:anthranilate phosphoribosyltransferase
MDPDRSVLSLPAALARVAEGRSLSREESRAVMRRIMEGEATPAQIGAFLMGLRMKGETAHELAGAAEVMRELARPVQTRRRPLLDTCGTGGDRRGTYNISTAVAFVAAGAGVAVAKHGNRSVSSRSGSADVLEAAGVRIDLSPERMGRCLDEVGIAFLFAPVLHRAMKHALGPRKELGLRTFFNYLGPLTNPASASRQLLGVFAPGAARRVAEVLAVLGTEHAWVVHGHGGLDELSISGTSTAYEVTSGGTIDELEIDPRALGLAVGDPRETLGAGPEENAAWLRAVLRGERRDASTDMVLLNAAAAIRVGGGAASLQDGLAVARDSIETGRAANALEMLIEASGRP